MSTGWKHETITSLLTKAKEKSPSSTAIIDEERIVSYQELYDYAVNICQGFQELGIKPGEHIAVLVPNSLEAVVSMLGSWMNGCVVVPINNRFTLEEIEYVLKKSEVSVFILRDLYKYSCSEIINFLEIETNKESIISKKVKNIKEVIYASFDKNSYLVTLGDLCTIGKGSSLSLPVVTYKDMAVIQFTSGSTSFPKGVICEHGQIAGVAYYMGGAIDLWENDRHLSPLPFFHTAGLTGGLVASIGYQSCLILMGHFDPELALKLVEKWQVSILSGVETMFISMMDHKKSGQYYLGSLRVGFTTGSSEIMHRIYSEMGIKGICSLYGITEAMPNVSMTRPDDPIELRCRVAGKPHPGIEVCIREPNSMEILPLGKTGEICLKGWSITRGYYNMPEETSKAFDGEGWFHTGDLGYMDGEGYLVYEGRLKDMLKVGGENVSAAEVENILLNHPKVSQAYVIGFPDERLMEIPVAFIVKRLDTECTEDEIISYCQKHLAGYKVPRKIRFVTEDQLPHTGSGKVQKVELKKWAINTLPVNQDPR